MLLPVRGSSGRSHECSTARRLRPRCFQRSPGLHPVSGVWKRTRRELSEAGIREPELTLQVLSGMGGVWGFLIVSGWTLTLIAGVLLAVFP